ncbi:hypothetical protein Q9189_006623 [Teloschistes chrysophthalmus]
MAAAVGISNWSAFSECGNSRVIYSVRLGLCANHGPTAGLLLILFRHDPKLSSNSEMDPILSARFHRFLLESRAPEVDHASQAPEYRGDNDAPEVAPSSGVQVFFDKSTPEAIAVETSEDGVKSNGQALAQKSRRKLLILFLMATASIAIGLSVGIAFGLNRRGKDNTDKTAIPPSTLGAPAQPSVELHGLMSNTPLTAITTIPDNDRHLYFQERTGSFRRAVYSAQASPWRTAMDDAHLPPDAKNDTLLASVTGFLSDSPDLDILIYVNSTNQLSCVDWWGLRNSSRCTIMLPETSVAAGSRHISATTLGYNKDLRGLLLTYTDATSEKAVMMLGFVNTSYPQTTALYTWQNVTDRLISALDNYPGAVATACIAGTLEILLRLESWDLKSGSSDHVGAGTASLYWICRYNPNRIRDLQE